MCVVLIEHADPQDDDVRRAVMQVAQVLRRERVGEIVAGRL